MNATTLVRVMLLAALAALVAAWGLVHHYREMPAMTVPVQAAPALTYDPDAGEVPVPEIEQTQ